MSSSPTPSSTATPPPQRQVPPSTVRRLVSAQGLRTRVGTLTGGSAEPTPSPLPTLARTGQVYGEGRLVVLECLGTGGAGEVYLVHDRLLDRRAALKLMHPDEDGAPSEGALAEARALARLNHENVVTLYDCRVDDDSVYLLMEYLDGLPLNRCIGTPALTPIQAIEIALDVARGLDHAHGRGVLHLDLKPSNLFLLRNGRTKVVDFGVGSVHWARQRSGPGEAGAVIGTPLYMAPEQWGLGPLDARTDLWAAGVVLYEMLAGESPCPDRASSFGLGTARHSCVPALSSRLGLPDAIDALFTRALDRDPARRFQTASEWQTALQNLLPDLYATLTVPQSVWSEPGGRHAAVP